MPAMKPASCQRSTGARFLPGRGAFPAIAVAGCLVFAYVENGQLCVAIDLDDADPRVRSGQDGTVPVRVAIQGTEVLRLP